MSPATVPTTVADAAEGQVGQWTISAVIDIGTTSIRMAVAEIHDTGRIRLLEQLSQALPLGRDTFTKGFLEKRTIEDCVRILKSYHRVLQKFPVDRMGQVCVVATSAVREAANRNQVIDRVYSATGWDLTPIDAAEVNRLTYLSVQPLLRSDPELAASRALVVEIGGGSTEVLVVQNGDVRFAQAYRLGSLRLRGPIDAHHTARSSVTGILDVQIRRYTEQIAHQVQGEAMLSSVEGDRAGAPVDQMVGLGGELRFAAKQLVREYDPNQPARISVSALERLTASILELTEDQLVHKYHVSWPDAGPLGPALLAYVKLAHALHRPEIIVLPVTLRDGLLKEIAARGQPNEEFAVQVLRSASELARKFHVDESHARQVAKMCRILFQRIRDDHQLEPRYELLLQVAALLHEVGLYLNPGAYHKHSKYIIENSELFGLSRSDRTLIAQTVRYHRKSSPKPTHWEFQRLPRDQRIVVSKLASMLRVGDSLDASHSQRFHELKITKEGGRLVISAPQVDDLSLEQLALAQTGSLFSETFGLSPILRRLRV